jgi:outer membrane biosynthesis protein TonB
MTEHQSSRTLVKSAPELWAECSDAASLARHLGAFGEIRITKLEPETTVAWEGTAASGTVKLETSGWGTRVTLTVKEDPAPAEPEPEPEPEAIEPEPEPEATAPDIAPRPGMFARFRLAFRRRPEAIERDRVIEMAPEPEPELAAPAPPTPEPAAEAPPPPEPATEVPPVPEPVAEAPPPPEPPAESEPAPLAGEAALTAALESLGMAHHRPYSRA